MARTLAQYQPPVAAHGSDISITVSSIYLSATYALPVHGTVPRPISTQYAFDNITLLQEPYKVLDAQTVTFNKQLTIPVNTTRIIIGFRGSGKAYADNRELLGKGGGLLANDGGLDEYGEVGTAARIGGGSCTNLSITLAGITAPQPAYEFKWADGDGPVRSWADWGSFLQSNFGNTNGAQSMSEYIRDPLFAFRIMGDTDSVAQNLQVRASFSACAGKDGDEREMLVFCLGTSVIECQYDDDASFQPTSVSVQEVV